MEERPELAELMEDVNVGTKWYQLGIQLKIELRKLDEIDDTYRDTSRKVSSMYKVWLESKPGATRKELVAALKTRSVNEITLAVEYERKFSDNERQDLESNLVPSAAVGVQNLVHVVLVKNLQLHVHLDASNDDEAKQATILTPHRAIANMPSSNTPVKGDMDLMIISSYGDKWDSSVAVVPKQLRASSVRKEIEAIFDKYHKEKVLLQDVCLDWPGSQLSKSDHFARIKNIFERSKGNGVTIWYTGYGEKDTGNWCFKDGVISFQDIFGLYMDCMRGKQLTIVSDCSDSDNWIINCAITLDECDIGNDHSREDTQTVIHLYEQYMQKVEEIRETNEEEPEDKKNWRYMPSSCDMDLMIISSYGNEMDSSIEVVPKQQDNERASSVTRQVLVRKEMEAIIAKYREDKGIFLRDVCPDWPGSQLSKSEHLDRVKGTFEKCNNDGVLLWYTGHGEKDTGNWCFKDGVISFQNIFGLYMDCMRGKRLTIVSDCSYSGNWIKDCAITLDEIGIPSCGHHTREQGILLKIFTSSGANEENTIMTYIEEGVDINSKNCIVFLQKKLSSESNTSYGNFKMIRCSKATMPCEISSTYTWKDYILGKFVYCVRGKDRGREAWHYVLVDEDKVEFFNVVVATGNIDVADYGKILYSGWGKDPPEDIVHKINMRFGTLGD